MRVSNNAPSTVLSLLMCITAMTGIGCSKTEEAAELYARGSRMYSERRIEEALENFNRCIELDREMKQAYVMAAKCHFYLDRGEETIEMLVEVLDRDDAYVDANYWMGKVLFYRHELVEAERYLLTAIGEDSMHVDSRLLLGDLYRRMGSYDKALLNYSIVESNVDLVALAKINKAEIYIDSKEYRKAFDELDFVRDIGDFIMPQILDKAYEQLARIPPDQERNQ
jgi:tetratricopeptide (TPR) repeat protein